MKTRYYKNFEYTYCRSNNKPYVLRYWSRKNNGSMYARFATRKEMENFCDELIKNGYLYENVI